MVQNNGVNGHANNNVSSPIPAESEEVILFTSESVGEGHPGMYNTNNNTISHDPGTGTFFQNSTILRKLFLSL